MDLSRTADAQDRTSACSGSSPLSPPSTGTCCASKAQTITGAAGCCSSDLRDDLSGVDISGKSAGIRWVGLKRARRLALSPWGLTLSLLVASLVLDPARFSGIAGFALKAFAGTFPYVVLAVLLIGWLKAAEAEGAISRVFRGREAQAIVLAALFGGLAPFCSCEVIPFVAALLAVGAPLSAIMAFWLSSPLIDPPTLLITAGALGWPFAIGKMVFAVSLGLFGGGVISLAGRLGAFTAPSRSGPVAGCGCCDPLRSGRPVWRFWREPERRQVFRREALANAAFLIKWLALAYVLEALLVTYVPAQMIATLVGGEGLGTIVVAALVGMPAYLNSYVAPPLLAGLIDQGMGVGAAMAFMIAGAVSSVPAMAAVWSLVRPAVFAAYLGLGLVGAVLAGGLFQLVA